MPWVFSHDGNKLPWSIPLGSVLRIPIRLHVTFFVLWAAQTLGSIFYGTWYVLLSLITLGPLLLLTIVVHELGHCLAARSVGGTADSILLWPLGGLAFIGTHNTTPKKAIWVALAGPLTHVPMVAIWVGLLFPAYHASTGSWDIQLQMPRRLDGRTFGHALCVWGVAINIALFVFNLLVPAYPLDGGRIFANALLMAGVSVRAAAIATAAVAAPLGVALFVYGVVYFQMVTILVAAFILFSTLHLIMAIRQDKLAEHPLFEGVIHSGSVQAPAAAAAAGAGAGGAFPASAKSGTAAAAVLPGYPAGGRGAAVASGPAGRGASPLYAGNSV